MRILIVFSLIFSTMAAAEPPLPGGLEEPDKEKSSSEPALPGGLSSGPGSEPSLPGGLEADSDATQEPDLPDFGDTSDLESDDFGVSEWSVLGFWEARVGQRLQSDPLQRHTSIAESRLQISANYAGDTMTAALTGDLIYDDIEDQSTIRLNQGRGYLDLREAWLQWSMGRSVDMKLGRQILTWGTGDLLFINDLFPKDWNSFFIGRDTEYLKAPSDALKMSAYLNAVNVDVIWTPQFDADRFIDGRRISFFIPLAAGASGSDNPVNPYFPNADEWAVRVYKNVAGWELAGYGYDGFWKSPGGFDPVRNTASFPALRVFGASARGTLWGGVANLELGYYDSRDDDSGNNPFIPNSEWRLLLGFEKELRPNLTGGLQLYSESIDQYRQYLQTHPTGMPVRDHHRTLVTTRLTWLTHNQNTTWSLFMYHSPSDEDTYLRPQVSWKASDVLRLDAGFNLFSGQKAHTFFGQFEDASNAYIGFRYSF